MFSCLQAVPAATTNQSICAKFKRVTKNLKNLLQKHKMNISLSAIFQRIPLANYDIIMMEQPMECKGTMRPLLGSHRGPSGPLQLHHLSKVRLWAWENIPETHGKPMGNLWETHGKPMGNPWKPMETHVVFPFIGVSCTISLKSILA